MISTFDVNVQLTSKVDVKQDAFTLCSRFPSVCLTLTAESVLRNLPKTSSDLKSRGCPRRPPAGARSAQIPEGPL